jgi:hypothetical protein
VAPQIFLGSIPDTSAARRALRDYALELAAALRTARMPDPVIALFDGRFAPDSVVDLLLLTPTAAVAAIIRSHPGPIDVHADGRWVSRSDGAILEENGLTPLAFAQQRRDALSQYLRNAGVTFERLVGALIYAPILDPTSEISLDIDDHRQHLKVLGFDEIAGLLQMLTRRGPQHSAAELRRVAGEILGGRLWHDGTRLLFEQAPACYSVRLLDAAGETRSRQPIYEGETIIGRRRAPRRTEYRVVISGDDLISIDHAVLSCDGERILLHDTSKNGTWLIGPNGEQEQIRSAEYPLEVGAMVRVGQTWLRIEEPDPALE